MIAATALCAVQGVLVCALLAEWSRRRRAERALRASEAALRSSASEAHILASRLIASHEAERRRVARELHDNLSQKLALDCIDIERLRVRASASPAIVDAAAHLFESAGDIAGDVYRLSHGLHPPKLELIGLASAIGDLCRDVSRRCDVRISFQDSAMNRRVPPDAALCLFRIAQEALQNVVKHSGATTAVVRLATTQRHVCLHIVDSGKGFDRTSTAGVGLGLLSMGERVRVVHGRIVIRSAAGHGTRIVVKLPMDPKGSGVNQPSQHVVVADATMKSHLDEQREMRLQYRDLELPARAAVAVDRGARFETMLAGQRHAACRQVRHHAKTNKGA